MELPATLAADETFVRSTLAALSGTTWWLEMMQLLVAVLSVLLLLTCVFAARIAQHAPAAKLTEALFLSGRRPREEGRDV